MSFLEQLRTEVQPRKPVCLFYSPPGVGKTSLAAEFPDVVFLVVARETGIEELKADRLVPTGIPVSPAFEKWIDVVQFVDELRTGNHPFKYLAVDSLSALQELCFRYVSAKFFNGDRGPAGFLSYGKGYEKAEEEWQLFIDQLEGMRATKDMGIILIAHSTMATESNVFGENWVKVVPQLHKRLSDVTVKWASLVGYMEYVANVAAKNDGHAKAQTMGGKRQMIVAPHPACVSKNRYNINDAIPLGTSAKEGFAHLMNAIRNAKEKTKTNATA